MSRTALLLPGGPDYHVPDQLAAVLTRLLQDPAEPRIRCDVTSDLDVLADPGVLARYSLVVPIWTEGSLTRPQEHGLAEAVLAGTALGCVHGASVAFRESLVYQAIVGGQFVEHPGGEVPYRVTIAAEHPVTEGVEDFDVVTEQYYLHVDPANHVLARTAFHGDFGPLSANGPVSMPVAWVRRYGAARVFYCALGHRPEVFDEPAAARLTGRGLRWAAGVL